MCVLQAWLGLSYVDAAALWSLFVAFGASIIQVYDAIILYISLIWHPVPCCSVGTVGCHGVNHEEH